MESEIDVPTKSRMSHVAVFNFGLHLLGGYVDDSRWLGKSHGSPSKADFVARLNATYPALLLRTVQWLRGRGHRYVVFKSTNSITESKFSGPWQAAVSACSSTSAAADATACARFVTSCVATNGPGLADACRHLGFDNDGVGRINHLAAGALLDRSTASAPGRAAGHHGQSDGHLARFFAQGGDFVDGYLDASAVTRAHPECSVDGRHYFQLELANVRILSDAISEWEARKEATTK
jgi:hypothetical protein